MQKPRRPLIDEPISELEAERAMCLQELKRLLTLFSPLLFSTIPLFDDSATTFGKIFLFLVCLFCIVSILCLSCCGKKRDGEWGLIYPAEADRFLLPSECGEMANLLEGHAQLRKYRRKVLSSGRLFLKSELDTARAYKRRISSYRCDLREWSRTQIAHTRDCRRLYLEPA